MLTVTPLHGSAWSGRASTSEHVPMALRAIGAAEGAILEWKRRSNRIPLGADCPATHQIVNALDTFLSHRSLEGNQLYWSFVKEFVKRIDRNSLKKEWRATTARALSIAWLKDSLNKQTTAYYFQSFMSNAEIVHKYYATDAAMASNEVMVRVTKKLVEMLDVRFKFIKSFEHRLEVPIAEVRVNAVEGARGAVSSRSASSSQPSMATEKAVKARPTVVGSAELLDIALPPNFVEQQPSLDGFAAREKNDPDQVFIDVLRRKERSSLREKNGGASMQTSAAALDQQSSSAACISDAINHADNCDPSHDSLMKPLQSAVVVDPFAIALKSSLSKNKLPPVDEHHPNEPGYRLSPIAANVDLPCGELRLDMGEVIGLTINVFKHDTERFLRMFQIFTNFGTGVVEKRLLTLSNEAIYIVSLDPLRSSHATYVTRAYLPLKNIEHINVGPDYQVLYLHASVNFNVDEMDEKFSSVIDVCGACMQLGVAIVDAVKYAHDNAMCSSGKRKLEVFLDFTPNHLILHRFMSKELHEDDVKLLNYFLAQWRQTNLYSSSCEGYQHSGFLYHKEMRNKVSWLFNNEEFQHSYFHLENKKLYQFTDSTCKVGERIISLSDSVKCVVEIRGSKDSPYMFEIVFDNGSRVHFICQSASDLHKWVSLLSFSLTSLDSNNIAIPCLVCVSERSVLLAQEGLNCSIDGFMRLLVRIDLASVLQAIGVFDEERSACVLNDGKKLQWLMMRTPDEVDRLLGLLHKLGIKKIGSDEGGASRLSAILHSMPNSNNIFYFEKLVADDSFEVSFEVQ